MNSRTFRLDKLVRDKIVQKTQDDGGSVKFRVIKGKELNQALLRKLVEEAQEMAADNKWTECYASEPDRFPEVKNG